MAYTSPSYTWSTNTSNVTIASPGSSYSVGAIGAGGGGYGSNYILTTGGYSISPSVNYTTTSTSGISMEGNLRVNSDSYLKVDQDQINFQILMDNLKEINHRLMIIMEDKKLLTQHPTLKDAWERYHNAKSIQPMYNSKEFIEAYNDYILLEAMLKGTE